MRIPESELLINGDGSAFHIHMKPEELADIVILVGFCPAMTKRGDFAMKRTFKAIVAMILVLALGFAFSATVFAASAHAVDPQPAGIKNFFSSLIKKISDAIKNVIDNILGK